MTLMGFDRALSFSSPLTFSLLRGTKMGGKAAAENKVSWTERRADSGHSAEREERGEKKQGEKNKEKKTDGQQVAISDIIDFSLYSWRGRL